MRRIQVIVEDWQYQYLRNLAERKKTAISAELRNIIDQVALKSCSDDDPLFQATGIAEKSNESFANSETIDQRLYRGKE